MSEFPEFEALLTEHYLSIRQGTIQVTDPAEIASIRRNEREDIIGGWGGDGWYAYRWSLERWRKGRATDNGSEGRT